MNPLKIIFNRAFPLSIFMLLQIGLLAFMVLLFEEYFVYFFWVSLILSFIVVLIIINRRTNFVYKIGWIIPVFTFPLFGSLMYLLYGGNKHGKVTRNRTKELQGMIGLCLFQDEDTIDELQDININAANQAKYIYNFSKAPIYRKSYTEFYEVGEKAFSQMLKELRAAKKFIFLEYFIIESGIMWDTILEILVQKVKEGVEVRMIYDDIGCLFKVPGNYYQYLESLGIKCKVFHPLTPIFTLKYNNRDHRKILVIDNETAFTGGINLADEYINAYEKFGHWKDSAMMVKGPAVNSFTMFFLTMWDYVSKENTDYSTYLKVDEKSLLDIAERCEEAERMKKLKRKSEWNVRRLERKRTRKVEKIKRLTAAASGDYMSSYSEPEFEVLSPGIQNELSSISEIMSKPYSEIFREAELMEEEYAERYGGFVQPFSDSPLDEEALSETIYLNILGSAEDYVYITTPYLILDDTLKSAICAAGKRGVDVRIIVPHIPDKWYVHSVSKSHYQDLVDANVKVYEYTPGFIHSKVCIADDKYSVVGTINLDYRSLYLHFECGVWMYRSNANEAIKKDFMEMMEISELMNEKDLSVSLPKKMGRSILKILSPIM